jgi:predicted ATPase/DNA-binding CsgD family transcriptional regulator
MPMPTVLTSFVGRQRELEEVRRSLRSSRLVTLTGAAGCGKTRLALRAAADSRDQYAGGAHWVELTRITDPQFVLPSVAHAFDVAESSSRSLEDGLLDALQGKELLLVLDNCEHLLWACTTLVETLLKASTVRVLATSRQPLGVNGERLYPVAPLSLPPPGFSMDGVGEMGQFDAIRLFIERARSIVPAFELTPENVKVVADICRHLDGIPLAIELAAARVNVLAVEQIAARLDSRFELLAAAPHVSASHHRTLQAAIDWSYALLSVPEQIMLRRLSVFTGDCSLTTAETVCAGDGIQRGRVLELISSLINKSLLASETLQGDEARYALLETIRQYGQERLISLGEWTAMRDRHLQCYLELTEEVVPKLRGEYQLLWLNWMDNEYDNIRAALAWSLEGGRLESSRISAGLRIATGLYQFWRIRDYVEEGLTWSKRLLAESNDEISPIVRANALSYASLLAGIRGHIDDQMKYGDEAVVLSQAAGEAGKRALATALGAKGYAARKAGDHQTAFTLGLQEIKLLRESGDRYGLSLGLSINSFAAMSIGEYEQAHAMLDEALPLLREAGNPYRLAMALNFSGDLARCEQRYVQAESAYQESITLLRAIDAERDLASVLHNLGHACLHLGHVERAQVLFNESMAIHQDQENTLGMAECLLGFAALATVSHMPAAGARLLSAAVAHSGEHITSEWAATRLEYEHYASRLRAMMTARAYRAAQKAGQRWPLAQAVRKAQDTALKTAAAQKARKKLDELTQRENEVAALIARGMSNGEIAEALVLSKRTVEKHMANIRSKLAFTERAQIVRWAIETGLVDSAK